MGRASKKKRDNRSRRERLRSYGKAKHVRPKTVGEVIAEGVALEPETLSALGDVAAMKRGDKFDGGTVISEPLTYDYKLPAHLPEIEEILAPLAQQTPTRTEPERTPYLEPPPVNRDV